MKGRLAPNAVLQANVPLVSYKLPLNVSVESVSFNILNPTNEVAKVRVAISMSDVPAEEDFIEGPLKFDGEGSVLMREGHLISPGERLIFISDKTGLTVRVWGTENPNK